MQTLSAAARTQAARLRLKKSRRLATALLLAAAALFCLSTAFLHRYPQLAYLKAFSEAAMIGGLADWFAVTALFRRPLGLPVPHTAILPRNQNRIADELGRFIEYNFLRERPVALRVYRAAPTEKLLRRLADPAVRRIWLPPLCARLPDLLQTVPPEQAARFAAKLLAEQYDGGKIGGTLADGMELLKNRDMHESLFLALLGHTRTWLQSESTRVLLEQNLREWAAKIDSGSPDGWDKLKASLKSALVGRVDDWVAAKVLDWADGCLADAAAQPDHALRQMFDRQYARMIGELRHSASWHRRLEAGKAQLAASPALRRSLAQLWQSLTEWTRRDTAAENSRIRAQIEKLLDRIPAQIERNPRLMRRADIRLALLARELLGSNKGRAAAFVAEQVKRWNGEEITDKLELGLGRDLQYIRINGTLVGGLAGLLIYSLSQWLF